MTPEKTFIDTNIFLYLLSSETAKAAQAEALIERGGNVSVQVLNECVDVMRRKWKMPWNEIYDLLEYIELNCRIALIDFLTHIRALEIAEKTGLRIYDALLVSSAEDTGCSVLYTEDMNSGQQIGAVTIRNPFAEA
jgi:predicted nucleic acid-binding protein